MAHIGHNIRAARERAVLSQGELAEKAGLSQTALSLIETGKSEPRMKTIRRIAEALGVDPRALKAPDNE